MTRDAFYRPRPRSRSSSSVVFDGQTRTSTRTFALFAVWLLVLPFVRAQLPPPSQDPLMSLMLATPPIDVDSPVIPAATFDPPVVRPGEWSTYRAAFNALEESIDWPEKFVAPPGLEVRPGAHGQMLAFGGTHLQPHTSFNYHVRASQPGRFRIPEFKLKIYDKEVTVPAAELDVAESPPPTVQTPLLLKLEFPQTNLYVGQPVRAVVRFPVGPNGQLLVPNQQPPVQISGQGFIFDNSSLRQRPELQPRGPALVFEATLVPLAAGALSAVAQSFVGNRLSGAIILSAPGQVISGGPPQFTLLESDPVAVQVRPLPREGKLPGFTGAVGTLELDPPVLSSNVIRLGEMTKLTVRIRGDANGSLAHLVPPPAPHVPDWQVSPAQPEGLPPQLMHAANYAIFSYILIPLSISPQATPPIPFSCFDPARGTYVDLTIPAVPVQIKPGAIPADVRALVEAHSSTPPEEKEPTLSGLAAGPGLGADSLIPIQRQAWFPFMPLAPLATFFGLWGWDRRRRYIAQHPDVVLRRRARRELRRERRKLHRAARAADAPRFAASAVRSMRVACAPHYPAEPRALVGSDVLALLPEGERNARSGEVIRRFFAVSDAAQFAQTQADVSELLRLQPELECVLGRLEEKL